MSHYKAFAPTFRRNTSSVNQLQSSFQMNYFLFQTEVKEEFFATLYTTVEESLEELVTIYETFI
jgi:N-acetyl-gamma-glutamyl-phosphate reductase